MLNSEWAKSELDKFIKLTEVVNRRGSAGPIRYSNVGSRDEIVAQSRVVEEIFDSEEAGWRNSLPDSDGRLWIQHRDTAIRIRESILRKEEIEQNLGEIAPELSAAKFHSWIWDGARSLWRSGHYREAVEAAIKKLNAETQNKVGRRDVSEAQLFGEIFSANPGSEGKALLLRMSNDGSKTFKSVQRGAAAFAEGIFAGIRNQLGHEDKVDMSEQEALEYLAALSVLARWVDDAELTKSK